MGKGLSYNIGIYIARLLKRPKIQKSSSLTIIVVYQDIIKAILYGCI